MFCWSAPLKGSEIALKVCDKSWQLPGIVLEYGALAEFCKVPPKMHGRFRMVLKYTD